MNDDAAARAAARSQWPIRKFQLGEEPSDDLTATTTAEERIAMVWQLTQDAWAFAGLPFPTYSRSETPVHVLSRRYGS